MATKIRLQADFKEFLKLLTSNKVEYLLIGGYAVAYYGYSRPTGDMDLWIAISPHNAERVDAALREFGFTPSIENFLKENSVVRMGVPPFRLEILTTIDGVSFPECYAARNTVVIDGVEANLINLRHLRLNKKASGRLKDLSDLENLPTEE
jgi:predicted nucleotidyltransferase